VGRYRGARFSRTPSSRPPRMAPGIEPKPPSTAAMNALITMRPIFVERNTTGAISTPATAPTTAASIQAAEKTRGTLIPMSEAAAGLEHERHAEGDDEDVPVGGRDRAPDHQALDHEPERGGADERGDHGHRERRAGARDGPGHERRDHEHLALGEVHGAGRVV